MNHEWLEDFGKMCKRTLALSIEDRIRYGFEYVYKPVLDDAEWRSFASMEDYRHWCRENLPPELGYGSSDDLDQDTLNGRIAAKVRCEIERRKHLAGYEEL